MSRWQPVNAWHIIGTTSGRATPSHPVRCNVSAMYFAHVSEPPMCRLLARRRFASAANSAVQSSPVDVSGQRAALAQQLLGGCRAPQWGSGAGRVSTCKQFNSKATGIETYQASTGGHRPDQPAPKPTLAHPSPSPTYPHTGCCRRPPCVRCRPAPGQPQSRRGLLASLVSTARCQTCTRVAVYSSLGTAK